MTTISTELGDELGQALERYLETHSDNPETVINRALKRFLLEEGFPAEDETLTDEELAALDRRKGGESTYTSWTEVKQGL